MHEREVLAERGDKASRPASHSPSEATSGNIHIAACKKITTSFVYCFGWRAFRKVSGGLPDDRGKGEIGGGPPGQIALDVDAAQFPQPLQLGRGLDPFGNDLLAEGLS